PFGGSARQVAEVVTNRSAAWSPDGRSIVYATDNRLYVVNDDGTGTRSVAILSGAPHWPRWAPDGRTIRFTVRTSRKAGTIPISEIWEVQVDGTALHPLLHGWHNPPQECCGSWTPDGAYYIFQSSSPERSDLWARPERARLFHRVDHRPIELTDGPLSFFA